MQQGKGYWVKNNKIIDISATTHIGYIIHNPEFFNTTSNAITLIYKRFDEKIGIEGKAREEIIKMVASYGWIRVRHYFKPNDYWSIQFDKFALRKVTIKSFLEWAVYEEKIIFPDEELMLLGYENNEHILYPNIDGGLKVFFKSVKELKTFTMIL